MSIIASYCIKEFEYLLSRSAVFIDLVLAYMSLPRSLSLFPILERMEGMCLKQVNCALVLFDIFSL